MQENPVLLEEWKGGLLYWSHGPVLLLWAELAIQVSDALQLG
jgi:hypothetical protein